MRSPVQIWLAAPRRRGHETVRDGVFFFKRDIPNNGGDFLHFAVGRVAGGAGDSAERINPFPTVGVLLRFAVIPRRECIYAFRRWTRGWRGG